MSKRLWLLGVGGLVLVGLLVACGSNYNSSSDGLVLVGSQGAALIETFSFNLDSGHVSAIFNSPNDTANQTCVLNGLPSSIVMDKSGSYAYAIVNANTSCNNSATGIQTFKVGSDGSVTATGNLLSLNGNVVPYTMKTDAAGKFLFVANRAQGNSSGSVSVFAIGNGSLTEVAGSPFTPTLSTGNLSPMTIDIIDVAATPTVFPSNEINGVQNAVCSDIGNTPPSNEYLYAVDTLNNQVFQFQVDTSSGTLSFPGTYTFNPSIATDPVPAGVAVDPCDRFVYVSDSQSNKVSAYTICNGLPTQSSGCPTQSQPSQLPPGGLVPVSGSPFSLTGSANGVGPIVVDPYGKFVYVVGTNSNTISTLTISPISGSLSAGASTTATGLRPTSITIRSDDSWMFVTNYNSASVSQYAITPESGALTAQQAIDTDNYPWGVAVK